MKRYTKKEIKEMVADAYEMKAATHKTEIVFQIYANGLYILDTEEDNVIDVLDNEEEAIESCKGINSGEFSDDGSKSDSYYKPILIDADSGERVTRANFEYYNLKSEWVQNLIKELETI